MPDPHANPTVVLICGEEEFAVKQQARQLHQHWCAETGGLDHETIDASAGTSSEALKALARLREALQTLPFFGGSKIVWFKNCTFLGEEPAAATQAVTASVHELAQELKVFDWRGVRLMISAGKVDKRRSFYKTLEKIGRVDWLPGLSASDKSWAQRAEMFVTQELRARDQAIDSDALGELVAAVGPNLRQLANETEKASLYAGDRKQITAADVRATVVHGKHSQAFALGEAFGERNLPLALQRLDEELWEMKSDKERSAIGLLYSLITKVRTLLLLKEMQAAGLVRSESSYDRFKAALERIPEDAFPADRRYNPRAIHPYVLFKAQDQTSRFTTAELIRAMDRLLASNQQLVSSTLDDALTLQRALVDILGASPGTPPRPSRPPRSRS